MTGRLTPNDDTQNNLFRELQIVVQKFEHSTYRTNQSKFNIKVLKVLNPTNKKT